MRDTPLPALPWEIATREHDVRHGCRTPIRITIADIDDGVAIVARGEQKRAFAGGAAVTAFALIYEIARKGSIIPKFDGVRPNWNMS